MRTRAVLAASTAIVGAAACAFAATHWNTLYDDALIYLRYVRNLDHGCGLRFNCDGPRVEGFSSVLYLALLWAGSLVTRQLVTLCQIIDLACLVAAGALAIATSMALAPRGSARSAAVGLATAAAFALDPFVLLNANIGMETALGAAMVTLVAYAAVEERPRLLVGAVIAAVLARPECILFAVALPLLPRMRRVRYLAPVVGALVLLSLTRLALFGAWLPNTYYAKSGGTWGHARLGAAYIARTIADFPLSWAAPLALAIAARRRACGYLLAVAVAWLAFFLRTGGDLFEYSRLWFPLVPALTALALAGAAELAARIGPRTAIAIPLACGLLAGGRAAIVHHIPAQGASERLREWAAVGGYLRAHYPPGTLVATVPIGAIGFYSELPILDLVGLTDPVIAHAGRSVPAALLTPLWIGHERHDTAYVLARKPEVIVTTMHRPRPWTLAEAKAGFWADWRLLQEIKAGRAPYHVRDAEIVPGDHWLMFERDPGS